jgi:Nickel/cobalt transporter regulator
MLRPLAIAVIFALAAPTIAAAQEHRDERRPPPGRPAPAVRPAPGPRPVVVPHPGPGPVVRGPVRGPYLFRGHPYAWHPVPFPRPWVYPPGYAYRLWAVGAVLPALFLAPTYYYTDWGLMGLPPPDPGFQYVQYGPDLLLVNVSTGEVVEVFPGAFS